MVQERAGANGISMSGKSKSVKKRSITGSSDIRSAQGVDKRSQILKAALRVFLEHEMSGYSWRAIDDR